MSIHDQAVLVASMVVDAKRPNQPGTATISNTSRCSTSNFAKLYYPSGQVLGSGSYARVESYRRRTDDKDVAVKVVEVYGSERCRSKVFKEIEIYSLCSGHPHIIDLLEYFEDDNGLFYLIFPRMSGSLFETVVQRGRLMEMEVANVIRQITSGLAYLHSKGIAHRDIKPENILCAQERKLDPVMICDFDLGSPVRLVRDGRSTTPTLLTPVGSAEFMAPEVVDAWLTDQASAYDKKCDVWSLGVFAYVLCCGYAPFNGQCGRQCGWQEGGGTHCHGCQMDLFSQIQSGEVNFPEPEWKMVSLDAKLFVRSLLVKDSRFRPSAVELLTNPWLLAPCAAQELLATPDNLKRGSDLSLMIERSNDAFRRTSLVNNRNNHFGDESPTSLSPIPVPAKFCLGSDDEADSDDENGGSNNDEHLLATTPRAGSGNLMALLSSKVPNQPPNSKSD